MAPGRPSPPFAGEYQEAVSDRPHKFDERLSSAIWLRCERLPTDGRAVRASSRRRFLPTRTASRRAAGT